MDEHPQGGKEGEEGCRNQTLKSVVVPFGILDPLGEGVQSHLYADVI